MNNRQMKPSVMADLRPTYVVRVQRSNRPRLPWVWEIYQNGRSTPYQRTLRGYRSAEEAWEAGRAAVARLSVQAGPIPLTPGSDQSARHRGRL